MERVLAVLAACSLALVPVGLEARGAHSGTEWLGASMGAAAGRFSLARGVIGGSVSGLVDGSFVAAGTAICFLPGTFDASIDGSPAGELHPSSHCGSDATVRIGAFAEVKAGEEAARPMTINWTDLAGRTYILRFETGEHHEAHDVRVLCLGAAGAGCHSAVVDTSHAALVSENGRTHDTGSRAQLTVVAGSEPIDLGVYDVPFTLTIDGL